MMKLTRVVLRDIEAWYLNGELILQDECNNRMTMLATALGYEVESLHSIYHTAASFSNQMPKQLVDVENFFKTYAKIK